MSDFQDVDVKKAFVSQEPKLEQITPKGSKFAGQETFVLEFDIGKPNWEKQGDEFVNNGSDFYTVRVYGEDAPRMKELLKVGMAVNVEGSMKQETYKDEKGIDRVAHIINAKDVSLSLSQNRVKGIDFAPKKEQENSKKNGMSKPISERGKSSLQPQAQNKGLSR